jgi:hypothetical protein
MFCQLLHPPEAHADGHQNPTAELVVRMPKAKDPEIHGTEEVEQHDLNDVLVLREGRHARYGDSEGGEWLIGQAQARPYRRNRRLCSPISPNQPCHQQHYLLCSYRY